MALNQQLRFGRAQPHEPDQLWCGDNLAVLATVADGAIDMIYIDPPFGTGKVRRGRALAYRDVPGDPDSFVAWLAPRLAHSRRVLAAHGSLFVHLDYRTAHYVKVALDRIFGRQRFINEIIWCYAVGGKSGRAFGRKHDTILWYARGADYAFFPDAVRVARRPGSHMRVIVGPDGAPVQEKTDRRTGKVYRYPVAAGKVPEDWWTDIEILNRSAGERTGWPSQKPERLVERLVCATTQTGDVVADWFLGSGTTAVVARRLDRRFVGGDVHSDAIDCAMKRLKAASVDDRSSRRPRDVLVSTVISPNTNEAASVIPARQPAVDSQRALHLPVTQTGQRGS